MSLFAGQIRAITLDVGHTLIEPREAVGQVYAQAAAKYGGRDLSQTELEKRFQTALRQAGGAVNTRADWARIVDVTFSGLLPRPPSETFFPELFERFAQAAAWRIYDDVWPALDALAVDRVRLGVISNWDHRLRQLLLELKLEERFEVIVVSCEIGIAKPAPEIFAAAAAALGVMPAEILHVGDNWEADVLGARAAGFRAVQIARGQEGSVDQISSLTDLQPSLNESE